MATTLGLDLGIASIGWCLFDDDEKGNPRKIIDIGSFVFDQIENPKSGQTENILRREKRLMRRQRRRKVRRLEDGRTLFQKTFGLDFFKVVNERHSPETPFDLKVKGLTEKLTPEEIMVALYHYLKYRGYKSNRKVDTGKDPDDKKLLSNISSLRKEISDRNASGEKIFASGLLLEKLKAKPKEEQRLHNTSNEFHLTVARDMYIDEITALLDRQIVFGVIGEDFKKEYLGLFQRQRDFSEGPDPSSKYHVSFANLIGTCVFDGKKRVGKDSYSAKQFVLLSALNNLMFKLDPSDAHYQRLSPEQIKILENFCLDKSEVKYSALFKKLDLVPFRIKGLALSRKQYKTAMAKFYEEHPEAKGGQGNGDPSTYEALSDFMQKKTLDVTFFKNSEIVYSLRRNLCARENLSEADAKLISENSFYDEIATILLTCKTDARIFDECSKRGYHTWIIDEVTKIKSVSKTIDLSLDLCRRLAAPLEHGLTYDKAMAEIGYDHSTISHSRLIGRIPDLDTALKETKQRLTNPVVRHTLVQLRNLLNAIADTYGIPTHFAIELNRDLKRNFEDRKEIRNAQMDNQANNLRLKATLLDKFPNHFKSVFDLSKKNNDLLRYKLFDQQGGVSPYTNKIIREDDIFDDNLFQIDHILPYSRSFDDSFNNKVLVETKENQNKGDQTPFEYFKDLAPLKAYLSTHYLPREKVSRLLAKDIDSDFLDKDFEDSSYIAILAKNLITYFMLPEGEQCRTIAGSMTEKLRDLWHVSGKTHSFISSSSLHYSRKFIEEYEYRSFEANEVGGPSLVFDFAFRKSGNFEVQIKKASATGDKPLTKDQTDFNNALKEFIAQQGYFKERFSLALNQTLRGLEESISYESVNPESSIRRQAGIYILGRVIDEVERDITAKDRSNDLHHAVDAAVIGCITPKIVKHLTQFYQKNERAIEYATGEVKLSLDEPYPYFADEVLARVYERDETKLLSLLNDLPMYQENPAIEKTVHVLWPARSTEKDITGAISNETIFGFDKSSGMLTSKIAVAKLTKETLEKIMDKDGGNHAVYLACLDWLKKAGEKDRPPFPRLAKKGTLVRKVRILTGRTPSGIVDLSNDRYADNSDVVRVNVYRKNEGNKRFYFVPITYYQISRDKIRRRQFEEVKQGKRKAESVLSEPLYSLMWSQGDAGSCQITDDDLRKNYTLIACLPRHSLVEIERNGKKALCYTGGASSGMFEVYSLLGDNADLYYNGLTDSLRDRNLLTISTISALKVRSISVLGKIS